MQRNLPLRLKNCIHHETSRNIIEGAFLVNVVSVKMMKIMQVKYRPIIVRQVSAILAALRTKSPASPVAPTYQTLHQRRDID